MKLFKSLLTAALATAFLGGAVAPVFAELPKEPKNISVMDTNNNGRIEKDEFLAYMSTSFDELAGDKGYCTFEEVKLGFERLNEMIAP
ncbi:MAG TPA: hypothetical protein PL143_02415 [Rhodocyclaceae bacterium]|nr:hypothetical protein [Rhodocyclaceae bacterium]